MASKTAYRWFVTPLNNTSRRLDGPYNTRDEALAKCTERSSLESRTVAAWSLTNNNLPAYYVPTLVKIEVADDA